MIPVKHTITVNATNLTEDLVCFETDNYVGLYNELQNNWVVFRRSDTFFCAKFIGESETLEELDEDVYVEVGEHIKSVDYKMNYIIDIINA